MKENSNGSITYINNLNNNSINIMSFEGKVLENSSLKHNLIDLNGKIRIYNSYLESNGYQSKNLFNNIYIGKKDSIIDMNYYFKINGKKSYNNLKVEGVLDDNSKKNFRGTLDFIEGSKDSIGLEYENTLLLSDTALSRSLPMMLCHEEDVTGNHAESTGKINEDKLFYLMSRGMNKQEAKKLIIKSNFTNIINEINDEDNKEEVIKLIDKLI
jgi:Fe-S cluster assembly scaffold protein SufB